MPISLSIVARCDVMRIVVFSILRFQILSEDMDNDDQNGPYRHELPKHQQLVVKSWNFETLKL